MFKTLVAKVVIVSNLRCRPFFYTGWARCQRSGISRLTSYANAMNFQSCAHFFVLSRPPTYYCALYYLRCLPTVKKYFILNRNKMNIFDIFLAISSVFRTSVSASQTSEKFSNVVQWVRIHFLGFFLLLNPTQYFWLFCKFWRPKCHFWVILWKVHRKFPRHPKVSRNVFTSWIHSDQMSNGAHPRLSPLVFHSQFVLLLVYFVVKKITMGYGYYGYG